MAKIEIDNAEHSIKIPILLTASKSKIQIKNRSMTNEYGIPVATVRDGFQSTNYVEWMIGYDVKWGRIDNQGRWIKSKNEGELKKISETTLEDKQFIGANGFVKSLYELSEYIFYFFKWGVITSSQLKNIQDFLKNIDVKNLIDNNGELQIDRSHPSEKTILGTKFEYTQVKYPLLIHKYHQYEILTEIKISEKQYAVGTQPMLFLCFSISELKAECELVGRKAKSNETADFIINKDNIAVFLALLKMFGILSESHRFDVLKIIELILE